MRIKLFIRKADWDLYRSALMGFLHSQFFSLGADYPPSSAYYAWSVLNSDIRLRVQQNLNYGDGNNYSRLLANQTGLIDTPSAACIRKRASSGFALQSNLAPKNWRELCDRIS